MAKEGAWLCRQVHFSVLQCFWFARSFAFFALALRSFDAFNSVSGVFVCLR